MSDSPYDWRIVLFLLTIFAMFAGTQYLWRDSLPGLAEIDRAFLEAALPEGFRRSAECSTFSKASTSVTCHLPLDPFGKASDRINDSLKANGWRFMAWHGEGQGSRWCKGDAIVRLQSQYAYANRRELVVTVAFLPRSELARGGLDSAARHCLGWK